MAVRLTDKIWCLTFITVGEMTQWARLRNWSPRNATALDAWLDGLVMIDASWAAARTWGRICADTRARAHPPCTTSHTNV